jgi:hypothetical protein
MKKLILASALLILTAGCQQSSKSNPSSTTATLKDTVQDQTTIFDKKVAADAETGGDTGVVDSVSRQDAMDDIHTKLFKVATRLAMDTVATPESEEVTLLTEFFNKKNAEGVDVQNGLYQGTLKIDLGVKDLQGDLTDKQMQFTAIVKSFKKIAALYGFNEAQQDQIAAAVQKREVMLNPDFTGMAFLRLATKMFSEKSANLIETFKSGNDGDLCISMAVLAVNVKNVLAEKERAQFPSLIAVHVQYFQPLLDAVPVCETTYEKMNNVNKGLITDPTELAKVQKEIQDGMHIIRTTLATNLPKSIEKLDNVIYYMKRFADPTAKVMPYQSIQTLSERWMMTETKEILAANKITQDLTDAPVTSVQCDVIKNPKAPAEQKATTIKEYDGTAVIGLVDFKHGEGDKEMPFTVRKAEGQKGVTIIYKTSQVQPVDIGNAAYADMGVGFGGTVFHTFKGGPAMKMVLGTKEAPVSVECSVK